MKQVLKILSKSYIAFCVGCLVLLSVMAMFSPQSVMDLVQVKLNNADAISSIRGVYGGVGITLSISLLYLMFVDYLKALQFLAMFWGFYALSRIVTIWVEGQLGNFGSTWLILESIFALLSTFLWWMQTRQGQD